MRRALAFLCAALAACAPKPALHGTQFAQPPQAHDFTLVDQNDRPFTLSQNRGQAVALYFGFTHCKDVCPQTLALLGKARSIAKLSDSQLRIVMISVDPQHDSAEAMRRFLRRAGVQATALHGPPQVLRSVYREYGIAIRPEKNDIGHTDSIFLIDAQGRMRELLDPQTPLNDVAADLRAIVD